MKGRLAVLVALVPWLIAPVLPGEITGPEAFSSAACTTGQTWIKGASVWACGASDTRTYLANDVTEATGAAYTTIFTVPLDMTTGLNQAVVFHLIQSTSLAATAVQNRAQVSGANVVGNCHFGIPIAGGSLEQDLIALTTTSADTANTLGHVTDPFPSWVTCTLTASNTNATNLVLSFTAEDANTVTTHAGSWYEHVVN